MLRKSGAVSVVSARLSRARPSRPVRCSHPQCQRGGAGASRPVGEQVAVRVRHAGLPQGHQEAAATLFLLASLVDEPLEHCDVNRPYIHARDTFRHARSLIRFL
ncbi:hypothetical protein HPB50_011581 [Hyalomma asiaticum]|uniref:Uncharacterized protein n=1 Tax=Hyalomma asiaticum TaxID=266040 RepID=A0ACB7SE82_HYAAI|nr:hypothetical protein HPB50_011581 [Hyalomma asiaticum]